MSEERPKTPAYVSYTTLKGSWRALAHEGRLPPVIDSTVLQNLSGSTRAQFVSSLRFLGFVDGGNVPTKIGRDLAVSSDDQWKALLTPVLLTTYPNQLAALKEGTPKTFTDSFDVSSGQSIVVPAARFLLAAATDVGLPVSKYIKDRGISAPKPSRAAKPNGQTPITPPAPAATIEPKPNRSVHEILLSKFPELDPSWSKEEKQSWFESFQQLMVMVNKQEGG